MKVFTALILGIFLNAGPFACADTIVLKSGQSVTGNILEKTDKYIKIEVEGVGVTYYSDELKSASFAEKVSDSPDKLIQDVLESGGINKQIEDLPKVFISGMVSSCEQKNTAEACSMMKEAAMGSFKSEDFNKSVVDALQLYYDKDRLSAMLGFFRSPLEKKITQEELLSESAEALPQKSEFAKGLLSSPPSESRLALFERSDKAVHSTDLAVEASSLIAMELYEAVKNADQGQSGDDTAAQMQMELQLRVQLRGPMKNASRISFLFDYRHLSDQELNEHITFEESETGRWFTKIINKAFVDAMTLAGKNMAARIVALAREKSDALQAKFKAFSNEELYQQAQALLDKFSWGSNDDLNQALIRVEVIINRSPNFAKAYVAMGRIALRSTGNLSLARQYLAKALTLDPQLTDAYLEGGYVEMYAQDMDKAKAMLQKAKVIDPSSPRNELLEADIASAEKRYDDALDACQQALAKAKNPVDQWLIYYTMVEAYKQAGKKDEAKATYLKIIALKPDYVWTRVAYAEYLSFCGDWDQAIELAQQAIKQMDYPRMHKVLADAYYRKGWNLYWKKQNYNEGGSYFEKAYAEDPTIKGLNYSLGDYYRSINRLQDAVDAYRREIDIDPTNQDAQQELDKTLNAMGGTK